MCNPRGKCSKPLSPEAAIDHAAMALAEDAHEYRPWILQRGARAPLMLHLRRFDAKAGHWLGWQISYAHLAAVEYVGTGLVSLDCGARNFVLEGRNLGELVDHMQAGVVQCLQEFSAAAWPNVTASTMISRIRLLTQREG